MEPSLPALFLRTRVPGQTECLQSTARKLNQILLQGLYAEDILDLEILHLPCRALGADHETRTITVETGGDTIVAEARIVEVAQYRLLGDRLHREIVV